MYKNYLMITLRHLTANKSFAATNILGLAVGFACFILIGLFVRDELGYDRDYAHANRIFRLARDLHLEDGSPEIHGASNGPLEAGMFKQEFEEVEYAARLRPLRADIARGSNSFSENAVLADNELFGIFDFRWLSGNAADALLEPFAVVLTDSTARKYFGAEDPLGQALTLQGKYPVRVTGVIADLPQNTHLRFDMLLSMPTATTVLGPSALVNPTMNSYHTYVLLREGADVTRLEEQAPAMFKRTYGEEAAAVWGLTVSRVTDIHLYSQRDQELSAPGSVVTVYAFSTIAIVILLLACFNFMNLATARGTQRAKEVGIRKTLGAQRAGMLVQFIGEAVLTAGVAMVIALGLVEIALPAFNAYLQKDIVFRLFGDATTAPVLALLVLLVALVAGSYPAFYLSSFAPSGVLRGAAASGHGAARLRNCLVVAQFAIAIMLLVATAVVFLQVRFARDIDLGYTKEQVVVLSAPGSEGLGRQWDALKDRLLAAPDITQVTASNNVPGGAVGTNYFIFYEGGDTRRTMPVLLVDFGFFATYEIDLVAGRAFSPALDANRATAGNPAYIINELAARQLGWTPEEAIGKTFEVTCCNFGRGTIVGVVRDVYFESLRTPVSPMVYLLPPEPADVMSPETRLGLKQASIKIAAARVPETLANIRAAWAGFFPGVPANLRFLDDDFAALYVAEERQNQMLAGFSALAILIACLGLYGLVSFSSERRRKEIGVRKVMGGSVWGIVVLLTHDFSKLVLLSNVIAWPVAYFAMNRWLETFAYRIDLTPVIFIGSGLIALCIAWVTVGGTAAKAASAKPVIALRYE